MIIQTYKPEHYAIQYAAAQEYRGFFNQEFTRRRKLLYPPFTMMVRLLCESREEDLPREASTQLSERIAAFLAKKPGLKRRVLFVREDEAPIKRIMGHPRPGADENS